MKWFLQELYEKLQYGITKNIFVEEKIFNRDRNIWFVDGGILVGYRERVFVAVCRT